MLAILAAALATLAPLAPAAEGDSDREDDAGVRQPTMRELANKIDSAVPRSVLRSSTRDAEGDDRRQPDRRQRGA